MQGSTDPGFDLVEVVYECGGRGGGRFRASGTPPRRNNKQFNSNSDLTFHKICIFMLMVVIMYTN